jgi:hypothetical protein
MKRKNNQSMILRLLILTPHNDYDLGCHHVKIEYIADVSVESTEF